MRTVLALLTYFTFIPTLCVPASASENPFNDGASFQTAYSVKLGAAMGEMDKPDKTGVEKGTLCETDADCADSEKCKQSACVNVCNPNPCSSGYCLDEGGHSYSCVACLTDDQCSADKKCDDNACVDVCSGNNCASKSQLCSSDGNHGYRCYGCTSDSACSNDEYCDTTTKTCRTLCPDSCSGNLVCTVTGSHKASCTCESDANCPEKQKCDLETKQCVTACQYTPEICAQEIGGTAEDWYVEETDEGCECATDKKYVILANDHPNISYSSEKYKRIKAVKDFGNIKFGTLGGYIEKESNLSQTGNAWVGCDSSGCALVEGNAKVYGNALVTGGGRTEYDGKTPDGYGGATIVSGNSEIYEDAQVLKGSKIFNGKVHGKAIFHGTDTYSGAPTKPSKPRYYPSSISIAGEVYGSAHVYAGGGLGGSGSAGPNNNPKVYGNAIIAGGDGDRCIGARVTYLGQVYENAKIFRCGEVSGSAKVHGSAIVENTLFGVEGNAEVYGNARVQGNGVVTGRAKMYGNAVFNPAGSSGGVPYLCGTAVLSGSASITAKTGKTNAVCKGSFSGGSVGYQESYCSSKNCPQ